MLYAHEVMELMGPYPGRKWRMVQIVRYVARGRIMDLRERRAMRKAIARAIDALAETGTIIIDPPEKTRGAPAWYSWRPA